jgi:hypothetical protein
MNLQINIYIPICGRRVARDGKNWCKLFKLNGDLKIEKESK